MDNNPLSPENFAASLREAEERYQHQQKEIARENVTTVKLDSGNLYDAANHEFWLMYVQYPTGDRAIVVAEALFYERIGRVMCLPDGTDILREGHEHAFYIATIPISWEADINGTTIREEEL